MRKALFIVLSLVLTYAYLYPGSQALLEGRKDLVMSDGTDITGASFIWDAVRYTVEHKPSRFFYGAIYYDFADPERGFPLWMSWIERSVGLSFLFTNAVSLEQIPTAFVAFLMLLNILAMYCLCRYLRWNPWLAWGLALAWSFSSYTRARAQVHTAFAGTFHIPLIFLGLLLVVRGRTWKSAAGATALFLLASMAPHYYVVTAAFLTPFYLLYVFLQPEMRTDRKRIVKRLLFCVLPAVAFLALNLKYALPSDARIKPGQALPSTGEAPPGMLHPFLSIYAARPIDYFTSDLGLSRGPQDLNPLKTILNESVYETFFKEPGQGNTHERTNGIRWLIWALCVAALVGSVRSSKQTELRRQTAFFVGLALFAFALSLAPEALGYGPSAWLYKLVSQIRVPSRAGIWVHFSLLMIVGLWLSSELAPRRLRQLFLVPMVLPLFVVLEDPPFWQQQRMAPILPAYSALARDKGDCGVGFYFPFVHGQSLEVVYYRFLERMRFTNCTHLNSLVTPQHLAPIANAFPASQAFMGGLSSDLITPLRIQKLAECIPLSYIAFDQVTPIETVKTYCRSLGWTLNEDLTCVSPKKGAPLVKYPDECL